MQNDSLIIGKLEEKGDLINEKSSDSKLKWLSDKKLENFSYRVVFEADNPKHNHAIYITEWKEALKIRDFSIVAAIFDKTKNQNISPKDFIKHFSLYWKALHAYKFLKLIRIYTDQENRDLEENQKKMKSEDEKKLEKEKEKNEIEKKKRMEEELRLKEKEKINVLKNSLSLRDLNNKSMKDFVHYWLSISKNIQSLFLKSKPSKLNNLKMQKIMIFKSFEGN